MQRQIINPWTWQDTYGMVQANAVARVERTIYCSGQPSVDADGNPIHEGDMTAQIGQALDNLEAVLRDADCGLADVVRLTYHTTDVDAFLGAMELLVARLSEAGCRPATTLVGVSSLALPQLLVEFEAIAVA
jgi:enamine deaminase RidA (YjgF/YER057c/UK114 family)